MTWKTEVAIYFVASLFGIYLLYGLIHAGKFLSDNLPARVVVEAGR